MELDPLGRPVRKASARGSRRRRALGIGVAVFVLLGLIGFIVWWDAPPVVAPDLEPEPLPPLADDENGFVAFEGLAWSEHRRLREAIVMARPRDPGGALPDWDRLLADDVLAHYAPLLAAADEALKRPGFRFPRYRFDDVPTPVSAMQEAAKVMNLDAWSRFRAGDDEAAVRRAVDICEFGRAASGGRGHLGGWLVGNYIEMTGAMALLDFSTETDNREALALVLTLEEQWHASSGEVAAELRHSIGAEFAMMKEGAERLGRDWVVASGWNTRWNGDPAPWVTLFAKPNLTLSQGADILREVKLNTGELPSRRAWPLADELGSPRRSWRWRAYLDVNYFGSLANRLGSWAGPYVLERASRGQTRQTFALLMAALRLYEIDHGELPPTLDELVPEYLDEIQPDPYNGESLSYDPARRMVWSVGDDFVDSGGGTVPLGESGGSAEPTIVVP